MYHLHSISRTLVPKICVCDPCNDVYKYAVKQQLKTILTKNAMIYLQYTKNQQQGQWLLCQKSTNRKQQQEAELSIDLFHRSSLWKPQNFQLPQPICVLHYVGSVTVIHPLLICIIHTTVAKQIALRYIIMYRWSSWISLPSTLTPVKHVHHFTVHTLHFVF